MISDNCGHHAVITRGKQFESSQTDNIAYTACETLERWPLKFGSQIWWISLKYLAISSIRASLFFVEICLGKMGLPGLGLEVWLNYLLMAYLELWPHHLWELQCINLYSVSVMIHWGKIHSEAFFMFHSPSQAGLWLAMLMFCLNDYWVRPK